MKMKSKITYGLGLLFILIFVVSGFSIYYIDKISIDSQNIIKDNYKSLEFVSEMMKSLDKIRTYQVDIVLHDNNDIFDNSNDYQMAISNFEYYLKAEETNITEPGEKDAAKSIRECFNQLSGNEDSSLYKKDHSNNYLIRIQSLTSKIESSLLNIHELNMAAIIRKNGNAKVSSDRINVIMSALIAASILLAILYYFYFPKYVSLEIEVLSDKMKKIASGDYDKRINLELKDEFGDISRSFDQVVSKLQEKECNDR
jgi:two-component system, NtrC family, sensor histidine kinase KinB